MPLNLECPRCKQTLMAPTTRMGSYVKCPRCNGSMWVPDEPGANAGSPDAAPVLNTAPVPAPPSPALSPAVNPSSPAFRIAPPPPIPAPTRGPSPTVAPAPSPPGRPKQVARFISAETAQSTIKPAPDGKLPELRLDDKDRAAAEETKSKTVSPLTLLAILSLSIAISLMLVFLDFGPPQGANLAAKAAARAYIEQNYFPNVNESAIDRNKRPAQYQILLTEAQQACARGDCKTERAMYNTVLDKLRASRERFQKGLTGSPERDKELEARIIMLLGPD